MPKKTNLKLGKIIWAVDAFHENPKSQLKGLYAATQLLGNAPGEIVPVSVLRTGQFDDENSTFLEKWKDLGAAAEKRVQLLLKSGSWKKVPTPRFIESKGGSVSQSARALLNFTLDEEGDAIVVTSHGRKGLERGLLGSFAEALVMQSPLPVLVVNPKASVRGGIKKILFPTDFSKKSREVFDDILPIAEEAGAKIMLVHHVAHLYPDLGYRFVVSTASYTKAAKEWIEVAETYNVKTTFHLHTKGGRPVDEIVRCVKKLGAGTIVAMASESGPVTTVLAGSLTRQVLRSAPCPVLVVHPNRKSVLDEVVGQIRQAAYSYSARPILT